MPYTFLDAAASVQTAAASNVSGELQPLVQITSFLSAIPTTPSGNQSVSGSVGVVGNPSISGTVNVAGTPSISGTVEVAGNPSISGTVGLGGTIRSSVISSTPSSMLVGASIIGLTPVSISDTNVDVAGSVVAFQGTDPWIVTGSVQAQVDGSVVGFQGGTRITSIVGSTPSSTLAGVYAHRNDTVASFLGGDLTWRPLATDAAGRTLIKPFAAEEARVEGEHSVNGVSVTAVLPAAGAGLRNYITDIWLANSGAADTLVTFRSGGGTSVLGFTIAPAGSGSNLPGLQTPIRTLANETFDIQAATATSTLYATVKGFKAP